MTLAGARVPPPARRPRQGARRTGILLTAALPAGRLQSAGAYDPARSFELGELAETLDFINLMTYDMGTGFSAVSTFNAPLREDPADPLSPPLRRWNNVEGAIDYYREHGVPAHKLVLGVPFYGRGFRVSGEPTTACTSLTARRSRPAIGAPSRAGCWPTRVGSSTGIRSRRRRGCSTPTSASSSATKTPGRSASAPNSPRTAACAASSCGNSPATTSSTACCKRWCDRLNDVSGDRGVLRDAGRSRRAAGVYRPCALRHHHRYSCSVSSGTLTGMSCSRVRWSG